MNLFTIGFTQKSAERFFSLLQTAGVERVIDTRLNNRSQLAGFSKAEDLPYFLHAIASIGYTHAPEMAPTQAMLNRYKKDKVLWATYEREYLALLEERRLADSIDPNGLNNACLLCSEAKPTHCHRRLLAEYISRHFPGVRTTHLV
jgi:uncharacterized protein (DUF488 family)